MRYTFHGLSTFFFCFLLVACSSSTEQAKTTDEPKDAPEQTVGEESAARYSLAQWSFNRDLFAGEMTNQDFVKAAGEMGFEGVEYVSQFFQDKVEDNIYLDGLAAAAKQAGVKSLMIMIDGAGNLGASDLAERDLAVKEHLKWVRAAKRLGCPVIRVNAHGDGTPEAIKAACLDGIGRLAKAAAPEGVQIIIENHGGISNDGAWLADLVRQLQPLGVGSLADFDNWCTERENGQIWGAPCTKRYDRLQGLRELMPYAESVSVKAFKFDDEGNETVMDYEALFKIIREAEYEGYLGIEYDGDELSSREGIERTLALAKRSW
jgi:sugar phosphate isomerase/epimerase